MVERFVDIVQLSNKLGKMFMICPNVSCIVISIILICPKHKKKQPQLFNKDNKCNDVLNACLKFTKINFIFNFACSVLNKLHVYMGIFMIFKTAFRWNCEILFSYCGWQFMFSFHVRNKNTYYENNYEEISVKL